MQSSPNKDADFVISGFTPADLYETLDHVGGRIDTVGAQFAVVKFTRNGETFDIALPRVDQSTGPGHRDFVTQSGPGVTIWEDLNRRDLTVNMGTVDADTLELLLPPTGWDDLQNGVLRVPNDRSFIEDPLRLWRVPQFAARLGFWVEPHTFALMLRDASSARHLPPERVFEELVKLMERSEKPSIGLTIARDAGLLVQILPQLVDAVEMKQDGRYHEHDVWGHIMAAVDSSVASGDLVDRMAALLHDIGKPETFREKNALREGSFYSHELVGAGQAQDFLRRMRAGNALEHAVVPLVEHHMYVPDPEMSDAAIRRHVKRVGPENIQRLRRLRGNDLMGGHRGLAEALERNARYNERVDDLLRSQPPLAVTELAIDGSTVIRALVATGAKPANYRGDKQVGEILNGLLETVISDPAQNERDALLGHLAAAITHPRSGERTIVGPDGLVSRVPTETAQARRLIRETEQRHAAFEQALAETESVTLVPAARDTTPPEALRALIDPMMREVESPEHRRIIGAALSLYPAGVLHDLNAAGFRYQILKPGQTFRQLSKAMQEQQSDYADQRNAAGFYDPVERKAILREVTTACCLHEGNHAWDHSGDPELRGVESSGGRRYYSDWMPALVALKLDAFNLSKYACESDSAHEHAAEAMRAFLDVPDPTQMIATHPREELRKRAPEAFLLINGLWASREREHEINQPPRGWGGSDYPADYSLYETPPSATVGERSSSRMASSYRDLIRAVFLHREVTFGDHSYGWKEGEGLSVKDGTGERVIPLSALNRGIAQQLTNEAFAMVREDPKSFATLPGRELTELVGAVDGDAFPTTPTPKIQPPIGGTRDMVKDSIALQAQALSDQALEHERLDQRLSRARLDGQTVIVFTSLPTAEVRRLAGDHRIDSGASRVLGAVRPSLGESCLAVLPTPSKGIGGIQDLVAAAQRGAAVVYDAREDREHQATARDAVAWSSLTREGKATIDMVQDGRLDATGPLTLGGDLFNKAHTVVALAIDKLERASLDYDRGSVGRNASILEARAQ